MRATTSEHSMDQQPYVSTNPAAQPVRRIIPIASSSGPVTTAAGGACGTRKPGLPDSLWERVKAKGEPPVNGKAESHIAVRIDKALLKRCTALAKKKRVSRDALIARGLRALLAAEGE